MVPYYQKGIIMQSPRPINLLSIGNTIVDIEYQVNESTLTEFGIEKGSMTLIDNDKCDALQASLGPQFIVATAVQRPTAYL